MPPGSPAGTGLALARAKYALNEAGLDSHVELTRAHIVTNEVWLSPDFAIRVNRRTDRLLRREAHVGAALIDMLVEIVRTTQRVIEPFDVPTLIHGDLTFENVLWDRDHVTGLIDFEWSRAAPADLELDVFLRFCAFPELHVAEDYEAE